MGRLLQEGTDACISIQGVITHSVTNQINSLEHPAVDKTVHVNWNVLSALVLGWNGLRGPQHQRKRNEHRVVRHVSPDASPLPEAVNDVTFVLGVRRARCEGSVRIEVTRRVELARVVAIDSGVLVAQPDIHETHRSLGNEHSLVPVVFQRTMGDPDGQTGSPSKDLLHHGAQVREARKIGERRDPAAAYNGVQFCLGSSLSFGESDHSEHPPIHRAGRGLRTCTAGAALSARSEKTIYLQKVTHYIVLASHAISCSSRPWRLCFLMNVALKLGRSMPLACQWVKRCNP